MAWCLTKDKAKEFKKALKDGRINPFKLAEMTSTERHAFLSKFVGEENATHVNSLFESKLLLKNQKAGYISWAKRVSGITPQVRRDLISKIERLDHALDAREEKEFLDDLVETRLGLGVTEEEANTIFDLSKKLEVARSKANEDGAFSSEEDRLAYGLEQVRLETYVNELKLAARRIFLKEQPRKKLLSMAGELPGITKSIVASLDNSFFGRQGIKTLYTHPIVWTKNFLKSWKDIGQQLTAKGKWYTSGDDAVMNLIRADIYSRPNALNRKYDVGDYGLNVFSEEAYPSSLPEKIPLLGRLFKASEVAYNGAALRMRADLADIIIKKAEENGVNTLDRDQARGLGSLISSLTGRGSIGVFEPGAGKINVVFFSVKFLKSNFDAITAHQFDSKATPFAKKESSKNILKIIITVASILTLAKLLDSNSVDEDSRSTNFGKIKIWGHWTDITGGMASLVRLAARLVPSLHEGKWGLWSKSSSGKYTNLLEGKFGQQDAMDQIENFVEGKFSPIARLAVDVWTGKNYFGEQVTPKSALLQATTPISVQNLRELMKDPNSSFMLGSLILDGLGFSVSTYSLTKINWNSSTSVKLLLFKNKVGQAKFDEANRKFNQKYNEWYQKTTKLESFKNLSDEGKKKLTSDAKEKIQEEVLRGYNFVYKKPILPSSKQKEAEIIKRLTPR